MRTTTLIASMTLAGCSHAQPPKPSTSATPPSAVELAGTYKGTSEITLQRMDGTSMTDSKPIQFTVEPTGMGIAITFEPGQVPECGIGARVNGARLEIASPESCGAGTLTFATGELQGSQLGLTVQVKGAGGVTDYKIVGQRQP